VPRGWLEVAIFSATVVAVHLIAIVTPGGPASSVSPPPLVYADMAPAGPPKASVRADSHNRNGLRDQKEGADDATN
jgi:hypothetical protein